MERLAAIKNGASYSSTLGTKNQLSSSASFVLIEIFNLGVCHGQPLVYRWSF